MAAPGSLDLHLVLGIHARGRLDPAIRLASDGSAWRATRTREGPAAMHLLRGGTGVRARLWGPGAGVAAAGLRALLGLDDQPATLVPRHPAVVAALRRHPHLRLGRTGAVLEALIPAILEQKVSRNEAWSAYLALVRAYGEAAPGPAGLRLQPDPAVLAGLPYHAFHPLGIERRRAEVIRAVSRSSARLEELGRAVLAADDEQRRRRALASVGSALLAHRGIGPWTVAEVAIRAFGDPDAVSVGDANLPSLVTWALAGEPRGTDERMLELLEPYRGQRGRVIRLLELAGGGPPRRAPRAAPRRIERL